MQFLGVGPAVAMIIQSPCKEGFLKSYKKQFIFAQKFLTAVVHIM